MADGEVVVERYQRGAVRWSRSPEPRDTSRRPATNPSLTRSSGACDEAKYAVTGQKAARLPPVAWFRSRLLRRLGGSDKLERRRGNKERWKVAGGPPRTGLGDLCAREADAVTGRSPPPYSLNLTPITLYP